MGRLRGFTLVELMVVVAIIAVLVAIAYPAYSRYGYRARRVDGQELLLKIANAEERFYSTNNKYTSSMTDLGYSSSPVISEKGYYSVSVALDDTGGTSQGFTATAAGQGVQSQDACGDLSIDNTGKKLPDPTDTAHNSNGSCW